MADEQDKLFTLSLKDLKEDVRLLDNKFDKMHEILIKNTAVLEAHEQRSTKSEVRITELEDHQQKREDEINKLKGFFIYTGIIMTTLGSLGAIFHYWIQPFLFPGK